MMGEFDLRAALPCFCMPVSIVVGEEDDATPPAMSPALHEAIPGSVLHVICGGRHITPVQCREQIAGHLRKLVDRAASSRALLIRNCKRKLSAGLPER